MTEWLAAFWSDNQDTLIVNVVGGLILVVATTITTRLMISNTEQQRRRHLSKVERLKAKLEQHRIDQRDIGRATAF